MILQGDASWVIKHSGHSHEPWGYFSLKLRHSPKAKNIGPRVCERKGVKGEFGASAESGVRWFCRPLGDYAEGGEEPGGSGQGSSHWETALQIRCDTRANSLILGSCSKNTSGIRLRVFNNFGEVSVN